MAPSLLRERCNPATGSSNRCRTGAPARCAASSESPRCWPASACPWSKIEPADLRSVVTPGERDLVEWPTGQWNRHLLRVLRRDAHDLPDLFRRRGHRHFRERRPRSRAAPRPCSTCRERPPAGRSQGPPRGDGQSDQEGHRDTRPLPARELAGWGGDVRGSDGDGVALLGWSTGMDGCCGCCGCCDGVPCEDPAECAAGSGGAGGAGGAIA